MNSHSLFLAETDRVRDERALTPRITLGALAAGHSATVEALLGGASLVSRLAVLGFTPGATVTMLQNRGHGPIIVSVRDTRIALGRGEAEKITIRREGKIS